MALERNQLIAAGKELNELLELDPKIKVVGVKTADLEEAIKKTAKLFEEGDEISAELKEVFDGLDISLPKFVKVAGQEDGESTDEEGGEEQVVEFDDLVALATEMNSIMGLEPEIDLELEEEDLKAEILKNCYDDEECQIFDTDNFGEESLATLALLGVTPVVTTVAGKKDGKKDAGKKDGGKKEGGKKEGGKKDATKKGPGVISTIIDLIKTKGPIKKDAILEELKKIFPDREEKSMKATINVQIPGRINKERDFQIVDNGKGWEVKKK